MKVFEALYNPMTEESSYGTISIHLSREGAERAIAEHKEKKKKEWESFYLDKDEEPYSFGTFEDWSVNEVEVLP
jgi:hypothetical protein